MKFCYLDFEFTGISEPRLDLVSVAALCTDGGEVSHIREFWLFEGANKKRAKDFFRWAKEKGYIFVAYVMEAEMRSLITLFGPEAKDFMAGLKTIDLYLEYRCLLNHHHRLAYGHQYLNGEEIFTTPPPPKWERVEEDDDGRHHKPSYSLAACIYKLLGEKIDTEEKNTVRDIIIKGDRDLILFNLERIQTYNTSDILHLPRVLAAVYTLQKKSGLTLDAWLTHALSRGRYAVATARMVALGYPVNLDKIKKFTSKTKEILNEAVKDCLQSDPNLESFRFDRRQQRFVASEKAIRGWVEKQNKPRWRKTEKGSLSISKDAFYDWYDSSSVGFPGAFCRYLKTKQSLNGFSPTTGKKNNFFDHVGSDGRSRPFFGIFGSQSSRSQPGSTGFIPLKAHWMRTFIEAPAGRALAGVDYASQEFLIAAIVSQDRAMMDAYKSGDVYLAFAKASKLVPPDATKDSHKKMRDAAKQIVLGISYDMSASGLAPRLSDALSREVSEEEAQGYIDTFFDIYTDYSDWKEGVLHSYEEEDLLRLPDGWTMWGDNRNRRSVSNFPIQGLGAVVMREAVRLAQDRGLDVIYTLHDALYIEYDSFDVGRIEDLKFAMLDAFESVMRSYGVTIPIRLEGESWSVDYREKTPPPVENILYMDEYCDVKAIKDLERYKPFFT